jgi:hypothetical protein
MDQIENILIVTDEAESTRECALAIVTGLSGKRVKAVKTSEFQGTDLLAADFCFFGCAGRAPASFGYFEKIMRHINLALRGCAIFSPDSQAAVGYLAELIRDSGIKLAGEPFVGTEADAIKGWAGKIIN